jgi:AcrR family transcriptional regulator
VTYRAGIATRQRILDATGSLLAEGGVEAATVKAICDGAGVLPGSFYNLFGSKEQVVMTVVKEAINAVDPNPTGAGTETVAELVNAYVRFVTGEPVLARIYFVMAVGGGLTDRKMAQRVMRHHQARLDRFRRALLRDKPKFGAEEATAGIEALLAALNGYAFRALIDPDFDFPKHAENLLP